MEPLNLSEFETLARERLPQMVYDYYAGGAEDEVTLRDNPRAWERLRLRPRMLAGVGARDLKTTLLGDPIAFPILAAPCAFNAMAHPDGELAVARATAALGTIQILSTVSNYSIEQVAAASQGLRWFQLYVFKDRSVTRMLVERAERAGYRALCLTVDMPVLGRRERDMRNGFALPEGLMLKNLEQAALEKMDTIGAGSALGKYFAENIDPSLTWDDVDWLASVTKLPIAIKGILTADDARIALEHGVRAIIVSNHGGRQLDGARTGCDALPEVVEAVGNRAEILVDGGIRRGTDVLKALALGARAVLVGRPYLWGLAVNGEAGVRQIFQMLRDEFDAAMGLTGCAKISDINRRLIALNEKEKS